MCLRVILCPGTDSTGAVEGPAHFLPRLAKTIDFLPDQFRFSLFQPSCDVMKNGMFEALR